ncbi:MAG: dTDP-4-dehydrorhamnose 3,5-epimerase [Lachnospiraceae bacterium]|nr:dTDP-4-dehydrorhamnose 3,5-epimerase [Lachnospiraceae bacterium]
MNFRFEELPLKGAYLIEYFSAGDRRGEFSKYFEKGVYMDGGLTFEVYESFFTVSSKNVVRGLHFQKHSPQAKLVSVVSGKTWDVIVDLRPDSPTYKKWCGTELCRENHRAVYIPRGFAHGFASLEDDTVMLYQCEGKYDKETDGGIRLDDPDINIIWPVDNNKMVVSQRDLQLEDFRTYERSPMEL